MYLHLKELDINENDRQDLLDLYEHCFEYKDHWQKESGQEYIHWEYKDDFGNPCHLWFLPLAKRIPLIHQLESKVKYIQQSYFIISNGIIPHKDSERTGAISFELLNKENKGFNFYDDDLNLLDTFTFEGRTIMWNPQVNHNVNYTKEDRIYLQISFDFSFPYSFYEQAYLDRTLFRW